LSTQRCSCAPSTGGGAACCSARRSAPYLVMSVCMWATCCLIINLISSAKYLTNYRIKQTSTYTACAPQMELGPVACWLGSVPGFISSKQQPASQLSSRQRPVDCPK
jgi:hypothetical protein